MPKVQVYVSEELQQRLREAQVNSTRVCHEALEAAVLDKSSPQSRLADLRKAVRRVEEVVKP